eukprot:gb/GECH01000670.1/.p1 GENE.gb/GECH01000670.1/~~gb/GECH01000670.1/.p1  ORF type:complete len:136 (+),score=25.08 gb/GECH01000670.1/:1-408(+)
MIVCVAIVSAHNNPLYIRVFSSAEQPLRFHFTVHSALDLIMEKMTPRPPKDPYLGLLFPTESYKIYGYLTITNIKLIAVVEDHTSIDDSSLRRFFQVLHRNYVDAISNPFSESESSIQSHWFDRAIENAIQKVRG